MRPAAPTGATLAVLVFCFGCLEDSVGPGDATKNGAGSTRPPGIKGGNLPTLSTHPPRTFTAVKDTWWENISGQGTSLCTSDSTVWAKYEPCASLLLQRYDSGKIARTYLAIDFGTGDIPDDAIVTKATIRLFLTKATRNSNQTSPPPALACPPCAPGLCEYDEQPCAPGFHCRNTGMYFGHVDNPGAGMTKVDSVVTDVCDSTVYVLSQAQNSLIYNGLNSYATIDVPSTAMVSRTKITRYGIDLEDAQNDVVSLFQFNSADAPSNKPQLDVEYRTYEFYGAALGSATWAGFDTLLIPDLVGSSSYERLDETLSIWLVWKSSSATGEVQQLDPPIELSAATWWDSLGFGASDFTVSVFYDPPIDQEYHACPEGQGLQNVTLHDNGDLTVQDYNFGGIGSKVRIELRATDPDPVRSLVRVIALQWDNPGTYYDAFGDTVNAAPDGSHAGIVTMSEDIRLDPPDSLSFKLRLPTRVVEWVSTDIAGVDSIRVVNEADLAALSAELGYPVRWGFGTETRNYHVNVTMFGGSALRIDASDLAMMATDLDRDRCTGAAKIAASGSTAAGSNKEKILAWFGVAATGEMVPAGPAGELLPGYAIVDWEQNRRAIADPYGWRNQQP